MGSSKLYPAQLELPGDLALALFEAATISARAAAQVISDLSRKRGHGLTLRPGSKTPLWNELVKFALPHLRERGAKAQLARLLGVPRQRMNDFFNTRTACPDAERCLLLLCWVAARQQGRELLA